MRKITDDDLTLLFYGEHDDPALASTVAESRELSERFDSLSAELRLADNFVPPHREDDYGADVWRRISPRLGDDRAETSGRLKSWLATFSQPRFSLAGALSISLVAMLAFMLGRNGGPESIGTSMAPVNQNAIALAGIDSSRLLTHSVSGHLEQVDLMLTQFVNSTETSSRDSGFATDMLVANRLYRQAAASQGNHKLAAFLADLEPLLIELAYQAQSGSPATRERMQLEVRDGMLFRVRVMNKLLDKPQISV